MVILDTVLSCNDYMQLALFVEEKDVTYNPFTLAVALLYPSLSSNSSRESDRLDAVLIVLRRLEVREIEENVLICCPTRWLRGIPLTRPRQVRAGHHHDGDQLCREPRARRGHHLLRVGAQHDLDDARNHRLQRPPSPVQRSGPLRAALSHTALSASRSPSSS